MKLKCDICGFSVEIPFDGFTISVRMSEADKHWRFFEEKHKPCREMMLAKMFSKEEAKP